ncbi:AmmeMemoRadiSam system protein A [bacterium]|nr:AmmeMemoRadiSam system protein A [bacterium]
MLNSEQRQILLKIARETMETYIKTAKTPIFKIDDRPLNEEYGSFVTLHKKDQLRGCIGNIIGTKPLWETVRDMTIESATGDPRFSAVREDELEQIDIEISVLTHPKRIENIDEFHLGKHGVIIKRGFNQGVFLPQVAQETGWSKEEFLSSLCSHKAGLSPDAWKDKTTEIHIFSAQVFREKRAQNIIPLHC